jgi:hypothetical protein
VSADQDSRPTGQGPGEAEREARNEARLAWGRDNANPLNAFDAGWAAGVEYGCGVGAREEREKAVAALDEMTLRPDTEADVVLRERAVAAETALAETLEALAGLVSWIVDGDWPLDGGGHKRVSVSVMNPELRRARSVLAKHGESGEWM